MNCGNYPNTFKSELVEKVFKFAHKRPIIYWMDYFNYDKFIDNTKDNWRSDEIRFKKEELLDEIASLKRIDYEMRLRYNVLNYLDHRYYFILIKM